MNFTVFQKPRAKSLIGAGLKKLLIFSLAASVFMLANTLYLLINRWADLAGFDFLAVGEISLPKFFQVMVLSHTGVGLLLAVLFILFVLLHLKKIWRRNRKSTVITGVATVVVGAALTVSGLFILTEAASKNNAWVWWLHVICAALIPAGYILHRLTGFTRPHFSQFKKFTLALGVLTAVFLVWHGFSPKGLELTEEAKEAFEQGRDKGPGARNRDIAEFAPESTKENGFLPAGFVPPASPFFPSAATTASGDFLPSRIITRGKLETPEERLRADLEKFGFVKNVPIGAENCDRCHQDIVEQWSKSAHRFASFNNPFYEATINDMRENATAPNKWVDEHLEKFSLDPEAAGKVKSKWCSACHDPALMLAGKMDDEVDRNSFEAQAGLTCLACHAIDKIHNNTGNGNYNIADEQEDPYLFPDAERGTAGAYLHDAVLKAKPAVHKRQLQKPFFSTSEFCATCHKVSLVEPVNNYRWLRGQDEFDNWHDSGVSMNASRTFYLPPFKRECQACHMPLEEAVLGDVAAKSGFVKSHRFLAVNTALPFLRGDTTTIKRIEEFLQSAKLRVDIFALKVGGDEPITVLNRANAQIPAGEKVTVDVVVRNQGVGHTFPGGTNDSNEGWLEFTVLGENGETLTISGFLDENGHLDPMAHVFKAVIVDKNGNAIQRRNAPDIHVTVFANVIGPGTADIAHYEFVVPPEFAGQRLKMSARLLWRKFDRAYTEFAFKANPEGFKQFDKVPDLPITEIAKDEVFVKMLPANVDVKITEGNRLEEDWVRFNDYGVGLLLEGDTRGAEKAFEAVAELQPERLDGHLNLAKTAVRDGNIEEAYAHLQKCEEIKVGDPQVAWVWGVALQEDGDYERAADAYKFVLESFPEDRASWRNLGRTYYLDQKYEQSLAALDKVLEIDPEDRVAWYHKMLCFRALGKTAEAAAAEAAYEYYQIDESAQEITRQFKLKNPGANLMSQQIRIHKLSFQ